MSEFTKDCYCVTSRGTAMPGHFMGIDGAGRATVMAPNGTEYTFPTDALLTVEEAEEQLRAWRVDRVRTGYQYEVMSHMAAVTVIRCYNPEHPVRSNYVITRTAHGCTCSCPSYLKGTNPCKHIQAMDEVLLLATERPAPVNVQPVNVPAVHTSDTW